METFPAYILRWDESKEKSRAEGHGVLLTFTRSFRLDMVQISAVYFDPFSTAVA